MAETFANDEARMERIIEQAKAVCGDDRIDNLLSVAADAHGFNRYCFHALVPFMFITQNPILMIGIALIVMPSSLLDVLLTAVSLPRDLFKLRRCQLSFFDKRSICEY